MKIKIEKNPNINLDTMLNLYIDPLYVYIPILKKGDYKLNDYVNKGTVFNNYICSVSGVISGIKKIKINNKYYPALEIKNDFNENGEKRKKITKVKSIDEFIYILKENNLTNILNKIPRQINHLIITSIDIPYCYSEEMVLENNYKKIFATIEMLNKIFNIPKSIIAINNTSFKAIKNVKSIIGTYPNIDIHLVNDYYLSWDKDILCNDLNISKDDTLVLNTCEINDLYNILIKGNTINETFITISGDAIKKSLVIKTRLGVSLKEIIDKLITINIDNYVVYLNNPLECNIIDNIDEYIITKDISLIVINKKEDIKISECINCGLCSKVCPVNIDVVKCYKKNIQNDKCIGCFLCDYICPSKIKLEEKINGGSNE